MSQVIYRGKIEADRIEDFLTETERVLGKTLVILQADGTDEESKYVQLKRDLGERAGAIVNVEILDNKDEVIDRIKELNRDETVDGILVQLPIWDADRGETEQILSTLNKSKDVDGLNPKSSFVPAVVMAVETILVDMELDKNSIPLAVVGSGGMVGKRLVKRLEELGYKVKGFEKDDNLFDLKNYKLIISTTGVANLIMPDMVDEGFMGIDLGYPKAEFTSAAADKASFITPVPGGVGPLTIVSLYVNLGM